MAALACSALPGTAGAFVGFGLALLPDDVKPPAEGTLLGSARLDSRKLEGLVLQLGHAAPVVSVGFLGKSAELVSAGRDGTVRFWDTEDGVMERTLRVGGAAWYDWIVEMAVAYDGNWFATAGSDGSVALWSVEDRARELLVPARAGVRVTGLAITGFGEELAIAYDDGQVVLWDTERDEAAVTIAAHDPGRVTVRYYDGGYGVATGGLEGVLKLWDVEDGKLLKALEAHEGKVLAIASGNWENVVATAGADGAIKLWLPGRGVVDRSWQGGAVTRMGLSFDDKDDWLAASGTEQAARLLGTREDGEAVVLGAGEPGASCLTFDRAGREVAGGGVDGSVRIWERSEGKLVRTFPGQGTITAVAVDPTGTRLAVAAAGASLSIWDLGDLTEVARRSWPDSAFTSVAFDGKGRSVLAGRSEGIVERFDAATGRYLSRFSTPLDRVDALAFSPDGTLFAAAGHGGEPVGRVLVFDADSGELQRSMAGHADDVTDLDFSTDSKHIASVGRDRSVRLFGAGSGKLQKTFDGHESYTTAVAAVGNGDRLVSGDLVGTLHFWDVAEGEETGSVQAHAAQVTALLVDPDGLIFSAGRDGAIRGWRLDATEPAYSLSVGEPITDLALTPAGDRFVAGLASGQTIVIERATLRWHLLTSVPDGWIATDDTQRFVCSGDGCHRVAYRDKRGRIKSVGSKDVSKLGRVIER